MITDLQKASMLKRLSAFILDAILLSILAVMFAWGLSTALQYDKYQTIVNDAHDRYAKEYGITERMMTSDPKALTEDEYQRMDAANRAIAADTEATKAYQMVINLQMLILTFGLLGGFLVLEFFVPLFLGNGQTVGKKIFGIGLMHTEGIRVRHVALFVRSILGKYAVETMIIGLCAVSFLNGVGSPLFLLIAAALILVQIVLLIVSNENAMIHDKMAMTVTVDLASQMIFETREELLEYKKEQHAEKVAAAKY